MCFCLCGLSGVDSLLSVQGVSGCAEVCAFSFYSFKTKGNLTKHLRSKAHYKRCVEMGVVPVPTVVDESHVNEAALALQVWDAMCFESCATFYLIKCYLFVINTNSHFNLTIYYKDPCKTTFPLLCVKLILLLISCCLFEDSS